MSKISSYILSDHDDECLILVRFVGIIFYLRWSPNDLSPAPHLLEDYLGHITELKRDDDNYNVLLTRLVSPFEALMSQLATTATSRSKQGPFSLNENLYPQWFLLKAAAAKGCQTVQPVHVNEADSPFCRPGEALRSDRLRKLDLGKWVPRWFSSHDVELSADEERHPLLYSPSKVIIKQSRTECFFKAFGPGCSGTISELIALRAIDDAIKRGAVPFDTRICRLYGLVADSVDPASSDTRLVGILFNYIEPKRRGILGTLQYVASEKQSQTHLRRWATDLDDIIGALHRGGCIWGDAKPENVLVDHDDEVWLIDFGGGFTPGWVDEKHQSTKTGDLEALRKIQQWLADKK